MNSKNKGEKTEGLILGKLLSLGYIVLMPFGNNQRYDMVVDKGNGFLKIQCKTGRKINGCINFNSCSTNGFTGKSKNYRGQIDYFIVYCPENNEFYEIPVSDVGIKIGVLRIEEPKRTTKGCKIRWAKEYKI